MIIINDKNKSNIVFFDRNLYGIPDPYDQSVTIRLTDRATNMDYDFVKEDLIYTNYGFYAFEIDFSDLPTGEYEYRILVTDTETGSSADRDDIIIASGMIRLNELEPDFETYETKREYITYEQK